MTLKRMAFGATLAWSFDGASQPMSCRLSDVAHEELIRVARPAGWCPGREGTDALEVLALGEAVFGNKGRAFALNAIAERQRVAVLL